MVFIRSDANPKIGAGHIMRCLSIADAVGKDKDAIAFVLADGNAKHLVESRGYRAVVLDSDYTKMEDELPKWPREPSEAIIVDSYYVTYDYLMMLRRITDKLVYIDDIASFAYPADILVNYNSYSSESMYKELYSTSPPELLLGPRFVPLRAEFKDMPVREQKEKAEDVLISTGGADPLHIALSIVRSSPSDFNYHILLGPMNTDKEEIKRLAEKNEKILLHENVSDMKELISVCDIAVSAAGSTMYEICACGVPLITFVLADNQILGAEAFERSGLAVDLGDMRCGSMCAERILTGIDKLAADHARRCEMGRRMQEMVDGYGAYRIAEGIGIR